MSGIGQSNPIKDRQSNAHVTIKNELEKIGDIRSEVPLAPPLPPPAPPASPVEALSQGQGSVTLKRGQDSEPMTFTSELQSKIRERKRGLRERFKERNQEHKERKNLPLAVPPPGNRIGRQKEKRLLTKSERDALSRPVSRVEMQPVYDQLNGVNGTGARMKIGTSSSDEEKTDEKVAIRSYPKRWIGIRSKPQAGDIALEMSPMVAKVVPYVRMPRQPKGNYCAFRESLKLLNIMYVNFAGGSVLENLIMSFDELQMQGAEVEVSAVIEDVEDETANL